MESRQSHHVLQTSWNGLHDSENVLHDDESPDEQTHCEDYNLPPEFHLDHEKNLLGHEKKTILVELDVLETEPCHGVDSPDAQPDDGHEKTLHEEHTSPWDEELHGGGESLNERLMAWHHKKTILDAPGVLVREPHHGEEGLDARQPGDGHDHALHGGYLGSVLQTWP